MENALPGFGELLPGFLLICAGFFVYFLPTIVGFKRNNPQIAGIMVVNLFLGWTLIGWVIALAMACWESGGSHKK